MAIKSKPTGVRFDLEKIEFIKQREKLKSNQQVVDLLMNRYWWEHKVAVPTHKYVPPLNLKQEFESPKDSLSLPFVTKGVVKRKLPQEWVDEKREIADGDTDSYKEWISALDAATYLTDKQKKEIKFA